MPSLGGWIKASVQRLKVEDKTFIFLQCNLISIWSLHSTGSGEKKFSLRHFWIFSSSFPFPRLTCKLQGLIEYWGQGGTIRSTMLSVHPLRGPSFLPNLHLQFCTVWGHDGKRISDSAAVILGMGFPMKSQMPAAKTHLSGTPSGILGPHPLRSSKA